jgi:hypothetical protein
MAAWPEKYAPKSTLEIVMRPPESLRANPRNARKHSKYQIRQVADSINAFGNRVPIIIDENSVILAGHCRCSAAIELKLALVPTIMVQGLSEAQKRGFMLADNRLTEKGGWDRGALAIEFGELAELLKPVNLDLTITGFDSPEIDVILNGSGLAKPKPGDAVPPVQPQVISRPDDLWLLGGNRLLCGTALSQSNIALLMDGEKARMAISDPPHNVRVADNDQGRGKSEHGEFILQGGMGRGEFTEFLTATCRNIAAACVDGAVVYLFTDWRRILEMQTAGEAVFGAPKDLIVWNKTSRGPGSFYPSQHELIFAWKTGMGEPDLGLGKNRRTRSNVWAYPSADQMADLAMHPTVKPLALVADAIRDCSTKGDVIRIAPYTFDEGGIRRDIEVPQARGADLHLVVC